MSLARARRAGPSHVAVVLVLAAAAFAALAAHQVVHALADWGCFPSAYDEYSHSALVPLASSAATLSFAGALFAFGDALFATRTEDWLRAAARTIARRRFGEIAAAILGLQFATLFAMESAEQVIAFGHLLGGPAWLGGPVAIALTIHIAAALCATAALAGAARFLAAAAALVRKIVATFAARRAPERAGAVARRTLPRRTPRCNVDARRLGKRGPPLLAT